MTSRPKEIEAHTNRWFFHPLSRALAQLLAKTSVHPNLVSFVGVGFGLAAAYNYYHFHDPKSVITGFVCMLIWHVLDGTDGMLARMTGKATVLGRAIDGVSGDGRVPFYGGELPRALDRPSGRLVTHRSSRGL